MNFLPAENKDQCSTK